MKIRTIQEVKKEFENPAKKSLANFFENHEKEDIRKHFLAPLGETNAELKQLTALFSDIKDPIDHIQGIYTFEMQLEGIAKKASIATVLSSIDKYAPNKDERKNKFIKCLTLITAVSAESHSLKLNYLLNISEAVETFSKRDDIDYLKSLHQREIRDAIKRGVYGSQEEAKILVKKIHELDTFMGELIFYENDGLFLYLLFIDHASRVKEILPSRKQFLKFSKAWEEFNLREISRIYLQN